jgi:hypothetical protein
MKRLLLATAMTLPLAGAMIARTHGEERASYVLGPFGRTDVKIGKQWCSGTLHLLDQQGQRDRATYHPAYDSTIYVVKLLPDETEDYCEVWDNDTAIVLDKCSVGKRCSIRGVVEGSRWGENNVIFGVNKVIPGVVR